MGGSSEARYRRVTSILGDFYCSFGVCSSESHVQGQEDLPTSPEDPGPTPEVLFLLVSLECVRLGKFPEAMDYNCLHEVLEMGSRVMKGEGQ